MATRRQAMAAFAAPLLGDALFGDNKDKPNVLWILGDDLGVELGCYGHPLVKTPNIDRLAADGVRFTNAHTTGPVCSASRSGFNVGLYQTTTGTHHHRSHRADGYRLPDNARLVSHRFRDAGYFTANIKEIAPGVRGTAKTDYNFTVEKPFDGDHWNQRPSGKPFYAQINFQAPHKGAAFVEARKQETLIDPAKLELPPYYPDHPIVRNEVANYFDAIQLLDAKVGVLLEKLEREKLLDSTAIFLFGDNGRCLIRGKQWLYEPGTHVPLIARYPRHLPKGTVREAPTSILDVTATSLAMAGLALPKPFHGRPLFGDAAKPRDYVATARDRCDMTVDRIRAVRNREFRYIRNFMPDRPYTQHNDYIRAQYPTQQVMKDLGAAGKLNATQELFLAPKKPPEELYYRVQDPHEVHNLAASPAHRKKLGEMSALLDQWMKETGDRGGEVYPDSAFAEPRA